MRLVAACLVILAAACAAERKPVAEKRAVSEPEARPEPASEVHEPAAPPDTAIPGLDPSFRSATTRGGSFTVAWRPVGAGAVPRNEHFDVEVLLFENGAPLAGAELGVAGWMPDHGHGLLVQPRAQETEPGHYVVSGLLLHMRGHWQLFFDVIRAGYSERAEFELDL